MKTLFTEEERETLQESRVHPYVGMAADKIVEYGLQTVSGLIKGAKHNAPPKMGVMQMAKVKREMKAAIEDVLKRNGVFTG